MAKTTSYADYQVLHAGSFTLDAATPNREKTLNFSTADNLLFTGGSRRLILAFMVRVHGHTQLKFRANQRQIGAWSLGTDLTIKGVWLPFGGTEVFPDGAQLHPQIEFQVPQEGKVDIENVVLWYQVTDAS